MRKVEKHSLRDLRRELGASQTKLAKEMGILQTGVSRIELQADALVSTLRRYAQALGCELEVAATKNGKRYVLRVG
jgi:transcriptional regulator with XRE-family HTH domain